ncbi:phosphate/phosphite/phosphonate ABC transporter substrate-binding protein [Massilia sp. CMS3.1]|uniref:phosphate/phosphite/phosphonate ABC transporter substrate-binding protein n=1 Tax=Massilia sp. CMS3.1 TaxID=3373083 RepID=UPI003EE62317
MSHSAARRTASLALLATCLPRFSHAQDLPSLEIGILPNISARVLLAQYEPMRTFLQRGLGRGVQLSTAASWNAFHARTLGLEYDLVITASHLARVAQLERGLVPLLMYEPAIKGMIICARKRPLKSAAELDGQTLALSNPQSLVTLRGFQWLSEKSLVRGRHFKTINTPTDDSVGNVVLQGDAIAAMLSGGEYRAIPGPIKEQLQVLATFAEVPGFVVLASPRLAPALVNAIKEALLRFAGGTPEGTAFFAATGFSAIRELPPGLMASMDPYVGTTKAILANPG